PALAWTLTEPSSDTACLATPPRRLASPPMTLPFCMAETSAIASNRTLVAPDSERAALTSSACCDGAVPPASALEQLDAVEASSKRPHIRRIVGRIASLPYRP